MLLDAFYRNVHRYPDKTALSFIEPPLQSLTYRELSERVDQTAHYLAKRGVYPGDRVALQLDKCLEFILLHLATVRLGAVSLPLNPAYPPDELLYFLSDSQARVFFGMQEAGPGLEGPLSGLPELRSAVFFDPGDARDFEGRVSAEAAGLPLGELRRSPDDTALMIYTSGTTGRPKGAEITHRNLVSNLEALHRAWGWRADDILLHALPIFHVHGLVVALHGALYAGATTLLMRRFDARQTLHNLVAENCTLFMGVPTIYQRLLSIEDAASFDLGHMRLLTSGSDRLPDEIFHAFHQVFGHSLLERYGMTETGMNLSNPLLGERRPGSVGLPLPGVEARVVDTESGEPMTDGEIGEVQIRGPHVFKGYWRQPEKSAGAFTPDGWLRTGDLGLREPDGYFILKGRSKDLIITGGLNVYPPEVERVLVEHPAVKASAVIGCPDPEWGERIVAVVEREPGHDTLPDELISFCRARLAAYKCPKAIHFIEALPRNAMGKVQKNALQSAICQGAS